MTPVLRLPALRQDLELISGQDENGEASFVIRDVIHNRYIEISADTGRLLANWKVDASVPEFVAHLAERGISVGEVDVSSFIMFLIRSDLVHRGVTHESAKQPSLFKRIFDFSLHNYLFLRIPLVYPDAFLKRTNHLIGIFGNRIFWMFTFLVLMLDIAFIGTRWDLAVVQVSTQSGLSLAIQFGLAFIVSKTVHELAHAYAASRKGCVVGSLGIGFMLGFPVFYADVTDSWRLTHRQDRLVVACAGLAAELTIGTYAIAIWLLAPASSLSSFFLFLGLAIWVSSILVNANPLIRFDGYHILCDLLGEKNFQEKSFASARSVWRWAIGFAEQPKEIQWRYPIYGFAAMIYRIVVVTGIAWFLYNFSFRLLGLALFAVEIWWFLARPIFLEYKAAKRDQLRFVAKGAGLWVRVAVCVSVGGLLFVPISTQVGAPAVATHEIVSRVFLRDAAQLTQDAARDRRLVSDGDRLLDVDDPSRRAQLEEITLSLQILERRRAALAVVDVDRSRVLALDAEIARERAKLAAVKEALQSQSPYATSQGKFIPLDEMEEGRWLAARMQIGHVVSGKMRFIAFVSERELSLIERSRTVQFVRDHDGRRYAGQITSISYAAEPTLPFPELATIHGGWIEARLSNGALISDHAIYRVEAIADDLNASVSARLTGTLLISSEPNSLAGRFVLWLAAVLRREARLG